MTFEDWSCLYTLRMDVWRRAQHDFWCQVAIASLRELLAGLMGCVGFYQDSKVSLAEEFIAQIAAIT